MRFHTPSADSCPTTKLRRRPVMNGTRGRRSSSRGGHPAQSCTDVAFQVEAVILYTLAVQSKGPNSRDSTPPLRMVRVVVLKAMIELRYQSGSPPAPVVPISPVASANDAAADSAAL